MSSIPPHTPRNTVRLVLFVFAALVVLIALIFVDFGMRVKPVAISSKERAFIQARNPVRVAIDKEFQPLQFINEQGLPDGMTPELLRQIGQATGLEFTFVPGSWAEGLRRLRSGQVDLIADATPTVSRRLDFLFTKPTNHHSTSLYVLDPVVGVESMNDLTGRRLGVLKDTSIVDDLRSFPSIGLVPYALTSELVAGLLTGDVDAIMGYDFQLRHQMFLMGVRGIKRVGQSFKSEEGCFAVRHEDVLLANILEKGMDALPEETKLRIEQKWVSTPTFFPHLKYLMQRYRHWAYAGAFVLLAMGLWNLFLQNRLASRLRALREGEQQYQALFDNAGDGIILLRDNVTVDVNRRALELLGQTREEVLSAPLYANAPEFQPDGTPSADKARALLRKAALGQPQTFEWLHQNSEGKPMFVDVALNAIATSDTTTVLAVCRDISSRKAAEREILLQKTYFQQLFENSPQAMAIVDTSAVILRVNSQFETLFGYSKEETQGKMLHKVIVPERLIHASLAVNPVASSGKVVHLDTVRRTKNGDEIDVDILVSPLIIDGSVTGAYVIYTDITERKRTEKELIYQAYHDRLTGLPNRAKLLDRIDHAIRRAQRNPGYAFALAYLDLDRFKVINDSLGHGVGDQLLMATAARLAETLRGVDTICRVGGDEFAIFMEENVTPDSAVTTVHRIQSAIRRPMYAGDHEIHTTTSVGLVMGPTSYSQPESMLRDAEIAMHQAKEKGKDGLISFETDMHKRAMQAMHLEKDLRHAVDNDEFIVHYQPIVDLLSGRAEGFEALARWNHPSRGVISPVDFIPLAEETGLIVPIGDFVLGQACRDFMHWRTTRPDLPLTFMAINLSARQFTRKDLPDDIRRALSESGMPPGALHLEITESVVMENAQATSHLLAELKALGVRLSIDDFGTGYSSLSYLHSFPVDALKIDRSFVARMTPGGEHEEIVRTIIQLAHTLGLEVVAEGVETPQQMELLRRMRCGLGQGYLWSKPVCADKALEFLATETVYA